MAFCMEELLSEYQDKAFFTSHRNTIEFLIAENLDALEEYALLIMEGKAVMITPHPLDWDGGECISYCGYSAECYQDKIANIHMILRDFTIPHTVEAMSERQVHADFLQKQGCEVTDVTGIMQERAEIKTQEQTDRIRECIACNEAAYREIKEHIQKGNTEIDAYAQILTAMNTNTGFSGEMIFDLLGGKRTGEVSGKPGNYRLQNADTLIVDLLPRCRGVYADTTRTFFIGEIHPMAYQWYQTLLEALEHAENLLKPGVRAKDIYRCVQETFDEHRTGAVFPHHAGHALGFDYYEAPRFVKNEEKELREGMIVAIEPGLYLPGKMGIRIENNYRITGDGAELLGTIPLAAEQFICG